MQKIPMRTKPLPTSYLGAALFGQEEIQAALSVLQAKSLFRYYGYRVLNKVKEFEREFARFCNVKYALGVTSGTAALHVALGAAGIGPGDEVIVTPLSFIASATPILFQNAVPIFADVDAETLTLSPQALSQKITKKTKAIVVVHYAGVPADMDPIMEIAESKGFIVIEDASHAHGAEYKGKKVGSIGNIAAFSCQYHKLITGGEGGIVTTNDPELYERAVRFHDHGSLRDGPDPHLFLGYNYRMTELQGAILVEQLKKLPTLIKRLDENIQPLLRAQDELNGIRLISAPAGAKRVWYQVLLRLNQRRASNKEKLTKAMAAEGTPVGAIGPLIYELPLFKNQNTFLRCKCPFDCPLYGKKVDYAKHRCPEAEKAKEEVLLIGNGPEWSADDFQDYVYAFKKVLATI